MVFGAFHLRAFFLVAAGAAAGAGAAAAVQKPSELHNRIQKNLVPRNFK